MVRNRITTNQQFSAIENRATHSSNMVCSFKIDNSSVTQKITMHHNPIAKLTNKLMPFGLGAIVNRQRATEAHSIPCGRNPPHILSQCKFCVRVTSPDGACHIIGCGAFLASEISLATQSCRTWCIIILWWCIVRHSA